MIGIRRSKYLSPENVSILIFSLGAILFFSIFYPNHLYQREQLQLFQTTGQYLLQNLTIQGGFSIWLGELLTQFFRYPLAGASIITGLLILLQILTARLIFKATGTDHFRIFSLIPAIGYFILLTDQYYYLSGLIGLILSVVASLFFIRIESSGFKTLTGILLIPVVYWLAGAAYIVFCFNQILSLIRFRKNQDRNSLLRSISDPVIFIIIAISIPLAARKFLLTDTLLQAYASGAYYAVSIFFPLPLIAVLGSVPLLLLVTKMIPRELAESRRMAGYSVFLVLAISILAAGSLFLFNFREEKIIGYENLVYDQNWDKIIKLGEKDRPGGTVELAAINLALAEKGELPDRMFEFPQKKESLFINYTRRGMTPFMASEPYYYPGLVNFSQMFAMETIESTVDAKLPVRSVKRAADTYLLNGQFAIAEKYLVLLKNTMFYKDRAARYLADIEQGRDPVEAPDLASIGKMMPRYDFYYDYQRMDVALKYLLISNPDNRVAAEYLIAWYLLNKDFDGLLQNIDLLKKIYGNSLPVVCQEAIAYILTRIPEDTAGLQSMITDRNVIDRLHAYATLFSSAERDTVRIKKDFGSSYWYYLHFR